MTVEWPDRRLDIIAALNVLAAPDPAVPDRHPSLTDPIHWLIDDTWWDKHDPAPDIGKLLIGAAEAQAIRDVLAPLEEILHDLGPVAPDEEYVQDDRWHHVAAAASACLRKLAASNI
jgi:hypothetical protein